MDCKSEKYVEHLIEIMEKKTKEFDKTADLNKRETLLKEMQDLDKMILSWHQTESKDWIELKRVEMIEETQKRRIELEKEKFCEMVRASKAEEKGKLLETIGRVCIGAGVPISVLAFEMGGHTLTTKALSTRNSSSKW